MRVTSSLIHYVKGFYVEHLLIKKLEFLWFLNKQVLFTFFVLNNVSEIYLKIYYKNMV